MLCDVWYTRVTVQTVKNQTVYSTNSRIPKRLRKNARSIGSYIKILFLSSFSLLQRKSPIIFTVFFFFFFYLFFLDCVYKALIPSFHLYTRFFAFFFSLGKKDLDWFFFPFRGIIKARSAESNDWPVYNTRTFKHVDGMCKRMSNSLADEAEQVTLSKVYTASYSRVVDTR